MARQVALHMMRYSANARDVHMLRALGRRVIGEAVKAHDRGIKTALAAVLGQYEVTHHYCLPDTERAL
eukprot:COSAG02_NODE_70_length_42239_cov_15.323090_29_plen_68_part_00